MQSNFSYSFIHKHFYISSFRLDIGYFKHLVNLNLATELLQHWRFFVHVQNHTHSERGKFNWKTFSCFDGHKKRKTFRRESKSDKCGSINELMGNGLFFNFHNQLNNIHQSTHSFIHPAPSWSKSGKFVCVCGCVKDIDGEYLGVTAKKWLQVALTIFDTHQSIIH